MEEPTNIKMEIATLVEGAELISVTTREEYEVLCRQEDVAVGLKKQVLAYFDGTEDKPGPVPKAYSLWKDLCGKRGDMVKPLDAFITLSKRVCGGFLAEEQRKEQARLDAIRKEAERIKAEQEARIAREAEELLQRQEAERRAQEEAFKNSPAELAKAKSRLEAEQAAERARQSQQAEQVIDTSMIPTKAEAVSAGSNRTMVETWDYETVDENLIPNAYRLIDTAKIKKQVQLTKNLTNIPGIRPIKTMSVRRAGGPRGE